jgi:hypothetical protein
VSGTVLLDGTELRGARLTFVPVDADKAGQLASTQTAADGTFAVGGGLRSGEYKVLVGMDVFSAVGPSDRPLPPAEYQRKLKEASARLRPIPLRYGKADTTPLRISAPSGSVRLELTSKP